MRLSPFYPVWYLRNLASAHIYLGEYQEALTALERALERGDPAGWTYQLLAHTYLELERREDAAAAFAEFLKRQPDWTVAQLYEYFAPARNRESIERRADAYRELGAPERPPLPLPDKPSIAVLPFDNLSDEPDQEWFADGMTDDLITDLSKISGLFVIARNTAFTYKDQAVNVKTVGRELGVKHVLEGSVRRMGDQARINAQLIDAETGGHLWAERYDGKAEDIFGLQEEVLGKIVTSLAVQLTPAEVTKLARAPTESLEAYEHYQRGQQALYTFVGQALAQARDEFAAAIALDPEFAEAHVGYANVAFVAFRDGRLETMPGAEAWAKSETHALRALVLDPGNSDALGVLAARKSLEGDHEGAIEIAREGVAANPGRAEALIHLAMALNLSGEHEQSVEAVDTALRLDPKMNPHMNRDAGWVLFASKHYERALALLEAADSEAPTDGFTLLLLAPTYAHMGRAPEAAHTMARLKKQWPGVSIQALRQWGLSQIGRDEDLEHFISGTAKAGLNEWPYGFEGNPSLRLSEAEQKERIKEGVTIEGIWDFAGYGDTGEGVPGKIRMAADGRYYLVFGAIEVSGIRAVRDGMTCKRSGEHRGLWQCSHIYRNPEGTRENKNEYIQVMPDYVVYHTW
jgi:TolB-like protein/cytochrome c-type biogenesis protein CcmH/NrfG